MISVGVRIFLAALFAWSGIAKLSDPVMFAIALDAFQTGLPESVLHFATFAIPWTELTTALFLLSRSWSRAAALMVALLMATFIAAIVTLGIRGLDVDCPCFGSVEVFCSGPLGTCHHIRNGILLVIALWLVCRPEGATGKRSADHEKAAAT